MKILKSVQDSGLFLKGVSETIQDKAKEQKDGFLGMLLAPLRGSWLGNMLTGKGINRAGVAIMRTAYGSKGSSIKRPSKKKDS